MSAPSILGRTRNRTSCGVTMCLISARWLPFVSRSRTLQDFDTGLFHVDHVPAILDLAGVAVGRPRKSSKIDAAMVQSEEGRTTFQEALQTLPMPVWSLNVDQHCDYVHNNIMNIAHQVFRSRAKKARERPQLTEATINFINLKLRCYRWSVVRRLG